MQKEILSKLEGVESFDDLVSQVNADASKIPQAAFQQAIGMTDSTKQAGYQETYTNIQTFIRNAGARMASNWNNATTDPSQHNSKSFRYIIHAIQDPMLRIHRGLMSLQLELDSGIETDPSRSIDLLRTPERVDEKPLISTSYIDQDHKATWGGVGFILDVPSENIISTNTQDIGSPFYQGVDWVRQKLEIRNLMSPDFLLAGTAPTMYNELEITGTHPEDTTKKVRIVGVFIKKTPSGRTPGVQDELMRQVQNVAYRLGVPIIEIDEYVTPYRDSEPNAFISSGFNKPDEVSYDIAFNKDNKRYLIQVEPNLRFRATIIEEGGNFSRLMTPEEFDDAFTQIQSFVTQHPENQDLQTAYQKIFVESQVSRREQAHQLYEADQAQKQGLVYYADSFPYVGYKGDFIEWKMGGKRYVASKEESGEINWTVYSPGRMSERSGFLGASRLRSPFGDVPEPRQAVDRRAMTQSEREDLVKAVQDYIAVLPKTLEDRTKLITALKSLDPTIAIDSASTQPTAQRVEPSASEPLVSPFQSEPLKLDVPDFGSPFNFKIGKLNIGNLLKIFQEKLPKETDASPVADKKSLRPELDQIISLDNPSSAYDPAQLLDFVRTKLGYRQTYSQGVGVWEGFTLEQHTLEVMQNFERFGFAQNVSTAENLQVLPLVRFALVLHDIGKPKAVETGNKWLQYQFTRETIQREMKELGFEDQEINFVIALIDGDPLGGLIKGEIGIDAAYAQINQMAQKSGMPLEQFFQLVVGYYISDAYAYPALRVLFVLDENGRASISDRVHPFHELKNRIAGARMALVIQQAKDSIAIEVVEPGIQATYEVTALLPSQETGRIDAPLKETLPLIVATQPQGVLLPVKVSSVDAVAPTSFVEIDVVQKTNGSITVQLGLGSEPIQITRADTQSAKLQLAAAAITQLPKAYELKTEPQEIAVDAYQEQGKRTAQLFRQVINRLTENKFAIFRFSVEDEEQSIVDNIAREMEEFKAELDRLNQGAASSPTPHFFNVRFELVNKKNGDVIQFETTAQGMTQEELAEKLTNAPRFHSSVESGTFLKEAKDVKAGYLPTEGIYVGEEVRIFNYKAIGRTGLAVVTDSPSAPQMIEALTGADMGRMDVARTNLQLVKTPHVLLDGEDVSIQTYHKKSLIVRALAKFAQQLYQAYVTLRAAGTSA